MIRTVELNPSIDRTIFLEEMHEGVVNRATEVLSTASGKGMNVFRVVRLLGGQPAGIVALGGHLGAYYRTLLEQEFGDGAHAVETVPVRHETRINLNIVLGGSRKEYKINEHGSALDGGEADALLGRLRRRVRAGDWVEIGGSFQPHEHGRPLLLEVGEIAARRGARVALDVPNVPLADVAATAPAVVKPNREELAGLLGRALRSIGDVAAGAAEVAQRCGCIVIVTLGRNGALMVNGGETLLARVKPIRFGYSIGAGDAVMAGYLVGATRGWSDARAFALGVAAGRTWSATAPRRPLERGAVEAAAEEILARLEPFGSAVGPARAPA